jgi:hypothetical protein
LQAAYAGLWEHLRSSYGYEAGVDMFAAPYDWRLDYDGLEQVRQIDAKSFGSIGVLLGCFV